MSKITFYVHHFDNQTDYDFIYSAIDAGVTSLKIEGDLVAVKKAHTRNKDLLIVYRNIKALEGDDDGGFRQDYKPGVASVEQAVDAHMRLLDAHLRGMIQYAYICNPYNEVGLDDLKMRRWMNDFEYQRQQRYRALGYRAAILSVGVKANLHDKIDELVPCLRLAYEYGNLIDLHAYNSKRLSDVGPYGNDVSEGLMPHRLMYDALKARGVGCARFFAGEGGHDAIASSHKEGPGYNGFRDMGLSNELVAEDYAWWEDQFIKRVPVLNIPIGAAHPADKLLVGIASFLFSDAPIIQPDYNTKWGEAPTKNDPDGDPGVAYRHLEFIREHPGDPVPAGGAPPTIPPPPPPPPPPDPAPGPAAPYEAVTVVDGMNVRDGDSDTARLIKSLPLGTTVTILNDGTRRAKVRVVVEGTILRSGVKPK